MITINLGPFSGKSAPEIHYHPSLADRLLEIVAVFCLLFGIGIICWNYYHTNSLPEYAIPRIIISMLLFALLFSGAYTSVHNINFPIRIGRHNAVKQYILFTRLMRVSNIFLTTFCIISPLSDYYTWTAILRITALILWFLSVVTYYILAFRYK
ncbi:uncharacterized protein BN461_01928 [Bacteroides sp. CAG:1076]|jgi:hypothetical protein|uniref:hypothetical protein n=1 Tax=Phocaeicola sp. TaxID=2773926 RepID=UPI00033E1956|nr:uncharacterized protein BN461_01928 [Bacteroides sp. CAG:1076]